MAWTDKDFDEAVKEATIMKADFGEGEEFLLDTKKLCELLNAASERNKQPQPSGD